jgi:hypothetical protein
LFRSLAQNLFVLWIDSFKGWFLPLELPWNKWCCKMGFSTMMHPQPSKDRKRAKKRHNRSVSPKRTRSSKSGRNSLATDISCQYPLENRIKRASRHASTRQFHRHHRHKKVSPSRTKVKLLLHITKCFGFGKRVVFYFTCYVCFYLP